MSNYLRLQSVLTQKKHSEPLKQASTSFVLDEKKGLVVATFSGEITAGDIAKYAKTLLSRPEFKPTFAEIVDLTEVTEFDLQATDFLRLADKIDPFWPAAKRAFVVRTSAQNYAARMHKILRSDRKIDIFQSREEALKWIDE